MGIGSLRKTVRKWGVNALNPATRQQSKPYQHHRKSFFSFPSSQSTGLIWKRHFISCKNGTSHKEGWEMSRLVRTQYLSQGIISQEVIREYLYRIQNGRFSFSTPVKIFMIWTFLVLVIIKQLNPCFPNWCPWCPDMSSDGDCYHLVSA